MRILVAEDHRRLANAVAEGLRREGMAVDVAYDGSDALAASSAVLGWFAAGRVLRPLRSITATARTISADNLHERLALSGPEDEFKALGDTLDDLLVRLEASFDAQRRFVANASHELRTPLTLERTLLQVALADANASAHTLRATRAGRSDRRGRGDAGPTAVRDRGQGPRG